MALLMTSKSIQSCKVAATIFTGVSLLGMHFHVTTLVSDLSKTLAAKFTSMRSLTSMYQQVPF